MLSHGGRRRGALSLLVRHRGYRTVRPLGPSFAWALWLPLLRLYVQPTSDWWVKFGTVPHKHVLTQHALQSQPIFIPFSFSLTQCYLSNIILSLLSVYSILSLAYSVLVFSLSNLPHCLTPTDRLTCAVQRRTHEVFSPVYYIASPDHHPL
jgi:hypothetical protein